ncbi:MAG: biotin--[acetyl-CoA-carboxylase] ligase [Armatimonadetes bacterium]|nr:biotin--[acetyl-CoA-carboxylase] ligase [Armatimonadota bacterium]
MIEYVGVVSSTNDIALQMARDGACEGTVVIADAQSAGRGRRGRLWLDEPGQSILMSIILRPEMPASELYGLSFAASLAVARFLGSDCHLSAQLRWPNDIYIGDRKIGGILVEMSGGTAIVGIGINVNQRAFHDELKDMATSVMLETGQSSNVRMLAQSLADAVMKAYNEFINAGFQAILSEWRKYMWGIGSLVQIDSEALTLKGVIQGVEASGALLVCNSDGVVHSIHAVDTIKTMTN